jgi:large conductance mechanosensitive channel
VSSVAVGVIDVGEDIMFKGFREFILRGSVVDLAVGVVMGAAFGAVVTGFVKDLLTPLIAAIAGKPDFSAYAFEINGSKFLVGDFLNAFISFLLISLAVYFFVVIPVNHLMTRFNLNAPAAKKTCPECQSEIPVAARKCAFCTSAVV